MACFFHALHCSGFMFDDCALRTLPTGFTHLAFRALLFPDFVFVFVASTGFSRPFHLLRNSSFPAPETTVSFIISLLLPFPDFMILLPALFTSFTSLRFARFSLVLTFSGFRGLSTGSTILTLSTLAVNFMMFLARPNVDHLFCIEIVETARKKY